VDAAVGERGGHVGEVAAIDQQRALAEIVFQRRHRVALGDVEIAQHPGDGAVTKPGVAFRLVDRLVQTQAAPGKCRQRSVQALPLVFGCVTCYQTGAGDGTGVNHRVARCAGVRIEADGIERVTARLDADPAHHCLDALIGQCLRIDEGLGHRLDGEGLRGVACGVGVAVHGDDAQPEPVGIGTRQFRDVAGQIAVVEGGKAAVEFSQIRLNGQAHEISG
jgi:hypothetical protein